MEGLVLADRIEGRSAQDGYPTGARRYRIEKDEVLTVVSSPVIEGLGELAMRALELLADFFAWAADDFSAERRVLVVWNHGDGGLLQAPEAALLPPGSSSDHRDGDLLSFAWGTVAQGDDDCGGTGRRTVGFETRAGDPVLNADGDPASQNPRWGELMRACTAD